MKIKPHYMVGGKKWKVERRWRVTDSQGNVADGVIRPKDRVIEIDHAVQKEDLKYVLVHELIHAAWSEMGIHLTDIGDNLEELLDHAATAVITENLDVRNKKNNS